MTLLYIFGGSAVAVALLVALAAWARIPRRAPVFAEAEARDLFALEFPTRTLSGLWLGEDGAVARSGDEALVLFRVGDGYAARSLPWNKAIASPVKDGRLNLSLGDFAAPRAVISLAAWPPEAAA
ncbi:MAG: hypothetical protein U1E50_17860 [Caulobacteraceae bacterium]